MASRPYCGLINSRLRMIVRKRRFAPCHEKGEFHPTGRNSPFRLECSWLRRIVSDSRLGREEARAKTNIPAISKTLQGANWHRDDDDPSQKSYRPTPPRCLRFLGLRTPLSFGRRHLAIGDESAFLRHLWLFLCFVFAFTGIALHSRFRCRDLGEAGIMPWQALEDQAQIA